MAFNPNTWRVAMLEIRLNEFVIWQTAVECKKAKSYHTLWHKKRFKENFPNIKMAKYAVFKKLMENKIRKNKNKNKLNFFC